MDRLFKLLNLKKMNRRERYAVFAAAGVLLAFILIRLVIYPFFSHTERLKRSLEVKSAMLAEMRQLQARYLAINRKSKMSMARFRQRPKDFTLFSFLDRLAGEAGVKDHISYM